MKVNIGNYWVLLLLAIGTVVSFTQCTEDDEVQSANVLEVDGNGNSQFNRNTLQTAINNLPKEDLSVGEEAGLIFMREEEKLAQDVYVKMYEKWNKQVFDNIADSEYTHTEAVLLLIDKYDLSDPVGSNIIGVFADTTLQQLYDDLTVTGFTSEIEALKVGAAIEEIDIIDLENQLGAIVDNEDIELVYSNLLKGSRNHLRAFVKNLTNQNFTYEPQYLSQEEYDEIVNGEIETGG